MYPPSIEPSCTEPYYTRSVWHVAECRCTKVKCTLPQLNLVVQSPTTPGQFDPPSPPSIEPSGTEPSYTMSVWHGVECRCTQVRCTPHPSIKPSGIELYYTRSVWAPPPPSIEPSGTESYYTSSVWHVEGCRHTQVRCTLPLPHSNLVVQSPTTPGQFDMWKNANVPSSDVPPLLQSHLVVQSPTTPGHVDPSPSMEPSGTEPYYTCQFAMWKNADVHRSDVPPQSNAVVQSPTTPGQFDPLPLPQLNQVVQSPTTPAQFDRWKNADIPSSDVPPSCNHTWWYRALVHQVMLTLLPQWNLVVQSPTTPGQFAMWKNADMPRSDVPPANWTKWYRALLHQVSLTCGRMQMYPGQMYPPVVKPSGTEPYYTRSVCHVKECRCTQVRCTPLNQM